jgi:hypothetical protein
MLTTITANIFTFNDYGIIFTLMNVAWTQQVLQFSE